MQEIQHYDRAAKRFYDSHPFRNLPVLGWDIFSEAFTSVCENLKDVSVISNIAKENRWEKSALFEKEILEKNHIVVVTDPELNIVHATSNIMKMNGYHPDEILGKKPKMFQGAETCQDTASHIRKNVMEKRPFEAVILNYRKDGSTYKCWIKGAPIRDRKGKVVNFIAFEKEVA